MLAVCSLGRFFDYETTLDEFVIQLITIMRLICRLGGSDFFSVRSNINAFRT